MKKEERISIARVFIDLIQADTIIDIGELEMYEQVKKTYAITREIEQAALEMTLSEALSTLSKNKTDVRECLLDKCSEMTVSDGFCAPQEAMLMIAITACLAESSIGSDEVFSINANDVTLADNQFLYVETAFNETFNQEIETHYRQIYNELRIIGMNFVYIPKIANRYRKFSDTFFKDVVNFLVPTLTENEVQQLIDKLSNITTAKFCNDQLCNRLGMDGLRDAGPSLLINIGYDYVNNQRYDNFLRIELVSDVLSTIQRIVEAYLQMLSSDTLVIPKTQESDSKFLYHGFYKQLFDMYAIQSGTRSKLVIDAYNGDFIFPDVKRKLEGLRRKEKALYALIINHSNEGGINFNMPTDKKSMSAYNNRITNIKKLYGQWYSLFGGDKDKVPNIEDPEIRRPMLSVIRKQVNALRPHIKNVDDYNIRKDDSGNYTVPVASELVEMKQKPNHEILPSKHKL